MTEQRKLPPAPGLPRPVYSGWACVWCETPLMEGAVLAGRAVGSIGAHVMDVDVYACGGQCATPPERKS